VAEPAALAYKHHATMTSSVRHCGQRKRFYVGRGLCEAKRSGYSPLLVWVSL